MRLLQCGEISLRPFTREDIPDKVRWINNPVNNRYLHYELPLRQEKTEEWFERIEHQPDRLDLVIEAGSTPVGLIGLLDLDASRRCAEYYICLGEPTCRGQGIAAHATRILLRHAFETLSLTRVYCYTETENHEAQILFERVGFRSEGHADETLICNHRKADRIVYAITAEMFYRTADGDSSVVSLSQ